MSEILISRVGEDPVSFNLEDIQRGAVRDSGKFPELFEVPMPDKSSLALISGVERKESEHSLNLEPFDLPVFLPPSLVPRALEDSKEEQQKQDEIALNKVHRGFITPIMSHAATLAPQAKKDFFDDIALRAHTDDVRKIAAFGDDRGLIIDPAFLNVLYGDLRAHSNQQVREIFDKHHQTPGKRVKEVDGAHLGVVNSVYLYGQAQDELRAQGIQFDEYTRMDTTLCFVPMLPGKLPLPEQGLVIKALGEPRQMRRVGENDIMNMARGRIPTYDHFDKPVNQGFPSWVTIHSLKRSLENDLTDYERKIYAQIDKVQARHFLTQIHSPGAAMTAFAHAMQIVRVGDSSPNLRPSFNQTSKPKIILTTGNFLGVSKTQLKKAFPLNGGKRVSGASEDLTLRNLEVAAHGAQGFAVVDSDKYSIETEEAKKYGSKSLAQSVRQLKTSLIASYLITMSTQAGALQHIGRPHLVDKEWFKKFGLYHPDLCNLGLTGDTEKEAYELFKDEQDIEEGLKHFDPKTYQHVVNPPANEFMSAKDIKKALGQDDLGYVVAVYGSSSGFADETYTYPKSLTEQLSKLKNTMIAHGGGTRSGMKGMGDGVAESKDSGYDVSVVGVRSETDVSPLEGNVEQYYEGIGYPLTKAMNNANHSTAANDQMHVLRFNRILPRQAAIAEIAHATVLFDGGKGTVLEFFITATHNAMVNTTGKGLLGHNRVVPLVVANRDIVHCGVKRGIFDALLEPWRDQAHLIGLKEFKGVDPVPEIISFLKDHAEGRTKIYGQKQALNFDVSSQSKPQLHGRSNKRESKPA